MTRPVYLTVLIAAGAALAGCGGGGGGTTLPPPGTTFGLEAAMVALETSGFQKTASISGSASVSGVTYPVGGSVTLTLAPIGAPTVFNGQTALLSSSSFSGSVSVAGQTLALSETQQAYLSTSYAPLGYVTSAAYCVAPVPGVVPATVVLGDSATVVAYDCYSDATLSVPTGSESLSYTIEPGISSTTVTVALRTRMTDPSGQQVAVEEDDYLLDTAGALALQRASLSGTFSGVAMTLQLTF